ncbi:MAG: TRAP transporter large permease subunit [Alphaproteobacteria bacterium]|jgi:tripartite ATP-independent transporter DctM subunit|nr:TRAP transporter large permease subunit [Alphaproteobacteria bacterium]
MFEFVDILPYAMLAALAILIFSGLPVAILLAGLGIAFSLIGIALDEMPWIALLNVPLRLYGSINGSLIYPTVPMLLFMGMALEKSGIARDLLLCLQHLLRRVPAGMAIAVTLLGVLLAPTAGVVGASVATLALIALPTMLDQGYRSSLASGVVAAAGTLGLILPPAIMLFFLAGKLRVPIGHIFLAAMWPAGILISLYLLYYITAAIISPPTATKGHTEQDWSQGWSPWQWFGFYVRGLILPAGLIFLVLGSIIFAWATPSQSGAVGAAGGLLLMLLNRRLTWPLFREAIEGTALMTAMVFFIVMAANIFSYPFRFFSGDEVVSGMLHGLAFGDWGMLLTIIGIIFILGFFIDWIEITVITLPLFLPVLAELDFAAHAGEGTGKALWMATLIALTLQTSFLTPPFGFALFFLKGAAPPEVKITDVYRGIVPVVGAQLFVIGLVMAFPLLASWLPNQLFN